MHIARITYYYNIEYKSMRRLYFNVSFKRNNTRYLIDTVTIYNIYN